MANSVSVAAKVRRFQICENMQGLETWSVAEIVDGRCKVIGNISEWKAVGVLISAGRIGLITIEATSFCMREGTATFSG